MKARVSERVEQAHIVRLLRLIGAQVYVLGTVRRKGDYAGTMQTPGIPDLYVMLPGLAVSRQSMKELLLRVPVIPGEPLWIEVKAKSGRLRPAQVEFQQHCERMGHAHIVGGLDAVIAWLLERGFIREHQVPAYRVPKKKTP